MYMYKHGSQSPSGPCRRRPVPPRKGPTLPVVSVCPMSLWAVFYRRAPLWQSQPADTVVHASPVSLVDIVMSATALPLS